MSACILPMFSVAGLIALVLSVAAYGVGLTLIVLLYRRRPCGCSNVNVMGVTDPAGQIACMRPVNSREPGAPE